ncbi:MAG: PQQ-binding-like beta-propeller repeat protein [Rickettsiales bacterium]
MRWQILLFIISCSEKKADLANMHNILYNNSEILVIDSFLADKFFSLAADEQQYNNSLLAKNSGSIYWQPETKDKLNFKKLKLSSSKFDYPFFTQAEIVDDKIFIYDAKANLLAYDLASKQNIWQLKLAAEIDKINLLAGGITYNKGKLYITIGNSYFYVVDATNGKLLWQKNLTFITRSKPFISGEIIYVNTNNNRIYAYNIKTKQRLWVQEFVSNDASQYGSSSFLEDGGILVTGNSNGDLILLDKLTGKIIWQENLGDINPESASYNFSDIDVTPILYAEDLYAVSSNGYLASYQLRSGIKNWDLKISSVYNRPCLTKDLLFIIDKNNNLLAISTSNGRIKWLEQLGNHLANVDEASFYGPVILGDKIMVLTNKGKIFLFNFNNGELIKKINIPKNINHPPVIINNKIYLLDNKSRIYISD